MAFLGMLHNGAVMALLFFVCHKWQSPATETSKQISLKSAVPTSAKSAYIESALK